MAETDTHRQAMIDTIETLADYFRADPQIYVAGNLLLYYEEGNPSASVAPDTFVVRGIGKQPRRVYKLWEEGRSPDIVIEFTSRSTRLEDLGTKRALYAMIGVREYFLCDPLAEYMQPPLRGFRLVEGEYTPLAPLEDGALLSQELGMRLRLEERGLRLINDATGEPLLRPAEVAAALRSTQQQLAARDAELAHLQAELAQLRGGQPAEEEE
jgi:Uma2 family endonuclease